MATPTTDARQQRLEELLTARDRLNTRIYAMARRELAQPEEWQQQAHDNRRDLAELIRILGTRHITHPRPRWGRDEQTEPPAPPHHPTRSAT